MNDSLLHVYCSAHRHDSASRSASPASHLKWSSLQEDGGSAGSEAVGVRAGGVSSSLDVSERLGCAGDELGADVEEEVGKESGRDLDDANSEGVETKATADAVVSQQELLSTNLDAQQQEAVPVRVVGGLDSRQPAAQGHPDVTCVGAQGQPESSGSSVEGCVTIQQVS